MNQLYDSRVLPTLRLAIIVDYFAGRERIQRESVYIYTIYSTRNRASGFVITDRRQEGGGSYSHVRAYEKLQPFHHLDVKFNAIRAILLRSDAFSLNAIRYPLSLSLFLFRALFGRERERESSVGKDRSMENYGYQAEKGKHFAREGAYRRNTDRDNWSQVMRTYEKGRR